MHNKYKELIEQTFEFPQGGFSVQNNELFFDEIPLMDIIRKYGTPLKLTYLPEIGDKIDKARQYFNVAMAKANYTGDYTYCYCTKSSHFSFILEEVLKYNAHLETSSAYDIQIIHKLYKSKLLDRQTLIVCNGFKRPLYTDYVNELIDKGFNVVPVLDNKDEIKAYGKTRQDVNLGIRIALEEEPRFEFYTSRLGIRQDEVIPFYLDHIKTRKNFHLKMLHFFINTGIRDSSYYWSELLRILNTYYELKKVCPELDTLNLGGGLPIANSLGFDFDYEYMIEEIVMQIKEFCKEKGIEEPHLVTEFGTYTVGASGINIYSVIGEKKQNDSETWYMIDNSFITTLPDTWGINQRHIMLPLNHWESPYKRVNLGGLTCDSQDYYNSEVHQNQVYLPVLEKQKKEPLYLGFFNTGAYQEALSGFGGIKHCLIPSPKHVLVDKKDGKYHTKLFSKEQSHKSMLKILGY